MINIKRKLLTLLCACALVGSIVAFPACGNNTTTENNETTTNETEKIELTMSNYTKYIDVKETNTVTNFSLKQISGVYMASGTGTLNYKVYPKQPVKCYNVVLEFSNNSPFGIAIGINAELDKTPHCNVPADGNYSESIGMTFTTGDSEELKKQVLYYGRTSADMIKSIESATYGISKVIAVSGYVVVE
jgi:hypothetical protein